MWWQVRFDGPGQIRIAILPFENLTGEERLGYLASGIAEETNLSLARIDLPNLSVIGAVSARALADSDLPLSQIGKQLGVDFIVASSLRLDQSVRNPACSRSLPSAIELPSSRELFSRRKVLAYTR